MDNSYSSFEAFGKDLQKHVGRECRLTEPFFGLGGMAAVLGAMGIRVHLVNTFELDDDVASWHRTLVQRNIRNTTGSVWSGKGTGDMMQLPVIQY